MIFLHNNFYLFFHFILIFKVISSFISRQYHNTFKCHKLTRNPELILEAKNSTASNSITSSGTTSNPFSSLKDSLFPAPTWDEESIYKDLYGVNDRDNYTTTRTNKAQIPPTFQQPTTTDVENVYKKIPEPLELPPNFVDFELTRMVEDRVYGYRRYPAKNNNNNYYLQDTTDSLLDREGAVKFDKNGKRLGNALKVNSDILTYHARKAFQRRDFKTAESLYSQALSIDPRDGRSYLGMARISEEHKEDLNLAREWLKNGLANSFTEHERFNPFLLQALGCLEERAGHLSEAETLFVNAVRTRPYHAASWVSLAKLRVEKLKLGAPAGRLCYQTAVQQMQKAGMKPSSYVYTAWAQLEFRVAADFRTARELFKKALEIDPRCSSAWLQLGLLEAQSDHQCAQSCFESVLKYDPNNARVLQAYAIMISKHPNEWDSREVIDLFERALNASKRKERNKDIAGVLQAYALYVANLGDIQAARKLLKKGTKLDRRHAPLWQAWGVLETRFGTAEAAREIFQQGIWASAQSGGSQSGGMQCARLWQAWGVLEAREEDYTSARRCFSRALDADKWNVPAIIAWTKMEEELGNYHDARSIFDRALKRFPFYCDDKKSIWRAYELMEVRIGNNKGAQAIYQKAMRESMNAQDMQQQQQNIPQTISDRNSSTSSVQSENKTQEDNIDENEVEVYRISRKTRNFVDGEVWINNGSIEGKVPQLAKKTREITRKKWKREN